MKNAAVRQSVGKAMGAVIDTLFGAYQRREGSAGCRNLHQTKVNDLSDDDGVIVGDRVRG